MSSIIKFLYSFLSDGAILLLYAAPIYIFLRGLYIKGSSDNKLNYRIKPDREIIMFGFFAFLVMLYAQTFIFNSGANQIRLIPFQVIIEQISEMRLTRLTYREFVFNIIGNVGIFVPIGIFIPVLFKKDIFGTALTGAFISLCIETGQIPIDRTTDRDDIILNTSGAVRGYGIYYFLSRKKPAGE